ncbi:hypothetical protein GA0074692_3874 [Micromonospora pallida]|uniref:Uncharacterized protein n=1 Tax=Micromonospora pallida TaxID=145854 RepID=A0A1C6SZT3_9ACTN|nr:hypothetical protein GA0074692_3874 [Micromonospora pallida]
MRFARALAGMLLLVIGIPALVVGGALWIVARHADPDGGFRARFEPVRTPGHAVVVTDLPDLLRRDAPFVQTGANRLRLTARTADGPAFLGLAPTSEVDRWLGDAPRAALTRVVVARGALPARVEPVGRAEPAVPTPEPVGQPFWVREGIGALEWDPAEFDGRSMTLVLMHPEGRPGLTLDVRAELRPGWLTPARWALPVGGALLVALALVLPLRPPRPREVVFVVEPDQVPVLAQRLGVTSLSALGAPSEEPPPASPAERTLVAVGTTTAEEVRALSPAGVPAIGAGPASRPAALPDSDGGPVTPADSAGRPATPAGPVGRPVGLPDSAGRPATLAGPVGRPATLADLCADRRGSAEEPAGRTPAGPPGLAWPPLSPPGGPAGGSGAAAD